MTIHNINQRICDYLLGRATVQEKKELEQWLAEDESHRVFFDEVAHRKDFSTAYRKYASIDKGKAWKHFKATELNVHKKTYLLRYAAVVVSLVISGALAWWYADYHKVIAPTVTAEIKQAIRENKQQGSIGVTIKPFYIKNAGKNGSAITNPLGNDIVEELEASQQVVTNHQRDYWLTLPDGTIVHLNYGSTLVYPLQFGDGRRDVILDGEAYFIVAKNRSRRFYVHTTQGLVCDYGTEFGVNTHEKGNSLAVVLVEGKVGVSPQNGHEMFLNPGQQAVVNGDKLTVAPADMEIYRFWNLNHVEFSEWPLQRVLQVLVKWHGCELVIDNAVSANVRISGTIYRNIDLASTLKSLQAVSETTISLENRNIIIK